MSYVRTEHVLSDDGRREGVKSISAKACWLRWTFGSEYVSSIDNYDMARNSGSRRATECGKVVVDLAM